MVAFDGIGSAVGVYFDSNEDDEIWISLSDESLRYEEGIQELTVDEALELIADLTDAVYIRQMGVL